MGKILRDVFLCHASQDKKQIIVPFTKLLEVRGISYWYDEAEIKIGDSISKKIEEGLKGSRFVLAFISHSFLKRKWPDRELRTALTSSIREKNKKVLPVLIDILPEQLFENYPLLSDIKFKTISVEPYLIGELLQLAEEIKDIVSSPPKAQETNKLIPNEISIEECLSSIEQYGLKADRWLRIETKQNNSPQLDSKEGMEALTISLQKSNIPVHINWAKVPTSRKYLLVNTLLSLVKVFNTSDVKGFNNQLSIEPGVFIHGFDRPKYSKKYSKELSIISASGCIINSEWLILLNIPAFFDAGWSDKLSMAPLIISRFRFKFSFGELLKKEYFNPWIPYDLNPSFVLCPVIGLSKSQRKDIQRFKYAPPFNCLGMSPYEFIKSDGLLLHNNGFLVIDKLSNIDYTFKLFELVLKKINIT
jgi:hypothetical protein